MGQSNIPSKDLEEDIDRYIRMGYRIDMIMPADAPREVLLSKGGESVRLRSKNRQRSSNADHVTGRAGMMYRDLIPGRAGGRIVAVATLFRDRDSLHAEEAFARDDHAALERLLK